MDHPRKPTTQEQKSTRPKSRTTGSAKTTTSNVASKSSAASSATTQPRAKSTRSGTTQSTRTDGGGIKPKGKTISTALVPRGQSRSVSRVQGGGTVSNTGAGTRSMIIPQGYTARPVIPAEKAELISVARAMNREEFGPRLQKLFDPETEAAAEAIQTGVYIGWRCPEFKWDCIRVGRQSRCFCGHVLQDHASYNGKSVRVPCKQGRCQCKAFAFIPARPEDIGEFWFQRRRDFDPTAWRAKCRCKHTHEEHQSDGYRSCKARGCSCGAFNSNFLCAACDRHWEEHETVFETESHRHQNKIPYGEDYLPFAEMPNLRNMALTGVDDDPGIYQALIDGRGPIPRSRAITDQNSPVRPNKSSGFKPVWD